MRIACLARSWFYFLGLGRSAHSVNCNVSAQIPLLQHLDICIPVESRRPVARHTRRNGIRTALGRRRIGKAEKALFVGKALDELNGKRR